jgi:hypothetical protein
MLALIVENQTHRAFAHFGGNLFVVLLMMLLPTQELEPPADPARFRSTVWQLAVNGGLRFVDRAIL